MKVMHGDSVEARIGALAAQVEKLERRMEENFEVVGQRFEQVDKRFGQHFEQIDKRFENLEADLREHRRDTKRGFEIVADRLEKTNRMIVFGALTMTGGFMAGFAGLITLVATQT